MSLPRHVIEKLGRRHDRGTFDCGSTVLNDWLRLRAGQFEKRGLARSFVAVRTGETLVRGYYALATHHVTAALLPDQEAKGLPRIDVPVVLIGRLAVDLTAQGSGLGGMLLHDSLQRILKLADEIGIRAVEVDAIDDRARAFYMRYGFFSLLDDPRHLYLPLRVIVQAATQPP